MGFTTGDQWEPAIAADRFNHVYVLYPQYLGVPGCKVFRWEREWHERSEAHGLTEGVAIGEAKGRAAVLERLLERRFGSVDEGIRARIAAATPDELLAYADRVLDALTDPAGAVVTCELNRERSTRLRRPDPQALAKWLERYAGYGEVRNAGHEQSILGEPLP